MVGLLYEMVLLLMVVVMVVVVGCVVGVKYFLKMVFV